MYFGFMLFCALLFCCFVASFNRLTKSHGSWLVCLFCDRLHSFVVVRFVVTVVGAAVPEGLPGTVVVIIMVVFVKVPRCVCFATVVVVIVLPSVVCIVVVVSDVVIACVY